MMAAIFTINKELITPSSSDVEACHETRIASKNKMAD
jgi:hypothetical protein